MILQRRVIALKIGAEGAHAKAASLIDAIKLKHPKISKIFRSDAGIRLQRRDADMAEWIMRRLGSHRIRVRPIHDSFITASRHDCALKEAMEIDWTHFFEADYYAFPKIYNKIGPQMETPSRPPPPSSSVVGSGAVHPALVVVLPVGRDLDLFGGRPLPAPDLAGWSSGPAPPAVRSYLRNEIRARDLRQSDVARRLGILRPQLVNILRGRFGASSRLALRLKAFADSLDGEGDPE